MSIVMERTEAIASKITPQEKIALEYLSLCKRTTISSLTRDALREKYDLDALAEEAASFFDGNARLGEHDTHQNDNPPAA